MKKRTAFAVIGLTLFSVTGGAFAAGKLFYHPFRDMSMSGHLLRVKSRFSGEVKLYDRDNKYFGSFGTDGTKNAPIAADVSIDDKPLQIFGAGRHELRDAAGDLIGYADLTPETAEERARWKEAHEKRMGHEAALSISSGCNDGYGTAQGYFGDEKEKGYVRWRFTGVGEAQFLLDGKIVRRGIANPVTPEVLDTLHKTMRPDEFDEQVRVAPPAQPVFEWTINGATQQHTGDSDMTLPLPDGSELTVHFLVKQ